MACFPLPDTSKRPEVMMLPQLHVRIEMMLQWYEGAEEHHSGGSALYKKKALLCAGNLPSSTLIFHNTRGAVVCALAN